MRNMCGVWHMVGRGMGMGIGNKIVNIIKRIMKWIDPGGPRDDFLKS